MPLCDYCRLALKTVQLDFSIYPTFPLPQHPIFFTWPSYFFPSIQTLLIMFSFLPSRFKMLFPLVSRGSFSDELSRCLLSLQRHDACQPALGEVQTFLPQQDSPVESSWLVLQQLLGLRELVVPWEQGEIVSKVASATLLVFRQNPAPLATMCWPAAGDSREETSAESWYGIRS